MRALQLHTGKKNQCGAALLIMLVILVMGVAAILVNSLNSATLKNARQEATANVLAQAKEALIGDTSSQSPVTSAGYLRLPDLGFGIGNVPAEGGSAPNFTGNDIDYSVIGKVPWKTLGISPSRDGQGECLWYVASGRFKNSPTTNTLNWDTQGQIDVIDVNGNVIASNIAALLAAPGQPFDVQDHALSDPVYTQCGGNYDARKYLDSYNISDAVSGEVNYFTGSTNNRVALNANNKRFVQASNGHYNDQFLFVTVDDIFRPIIRRSDFSQQITTLMNDLQGGGATTIDCSLATNSTFCNNWKEMLLITQLSAPSPITIDGTPTANCSHVLMFGGQKAAAQVRRNAAEKADPANYLEPQNLAAYDTPIATSNNFTGSSTFDASSPSADLLRCIP